MIKLQKYTLLLVFVASLVLTGCDDLFDKGDVHGKYEGPDVVAFKPLQAETDEGTNVTIEVQFISSEGLASSDINVSLSVNGESTAQDQHFNLSSTSVTIPAGSAAAEFTVEVPANSGLNPGDEVVLILNISSADTDIAENFSTTTIFIDGVDESAAPD